jgi:putative tricarboxylic transport membrane protein
MNGHRWRLRSGGYYQAHGAAFRQRSVAASLSLNINGTAAALGDPALYAQTPDARSRFPGGNRMLRRTFLQCALAVAAVSLAMPATSPAQTFPSRQLELVVHTSPGGGTDMIARLVADIMTKEKLVNQPVTVANKPGGGGAIAYGYIRSKRGDPHTIMSVASMALLTQTVRPELKLGLDTYTPLAFFAQDPQAVMVGADSPYKTFKDLIEAAKREGLAAAITSPGGTGRLLLWLMERETGARFKAVSFKSGSDAILQVVGGHVHLTTENMSEGFPLIEAKKLRVLAVTSKTRLPAVPDVPTLIELGYNIHVGTERGFAMPAGVPKEAAAHMEAVLARVHQSDAWKQYAERNMMENLWMSGADYAKHLAARRTLVLEFMQAVGIAPK